MPINKKHFVYWLAILLAGLCILAYFGKPARYSAEELYDALEKFDSADSAVRRHIAAELPYMSWQNSKYEVIASLKKHLTDSNAEVRIKAASSLLHIDPKSRDLALSVLRKELDGQNPEMKFQAAEILLYEPDSRDLAIARVLKGIEDPDPEIKKYAAQRLFWTLIPRADSNELGAGKQEVITVLKRHLADENRYVVSAAAIILGTVDPASRKAVMPLLVQVFDGREYYGADFAIRLFHDIGPEAREAVPPLIKAFKKDMDESSAKFRYGYNPPRYYTYHALKAIGTPEALEFLKPYEQLEARLKKLFHPVNITVILIYVLFFLRGIILRKNGKKVFHWFLLVPILCYGGILIMNWTEPLDLGILYSGKFFIILAAIGFGPWLISWFVLRHRAAKPTA